jgi:VanZ family protein
LNTSTRRIIKVWLPSVIWLAIITLESTNIGSSEHTARFLYPIFAFLFGLDPARFAIWHAMMRKAGHFVGYFILSVLLFRSWRATFPRLSTRWCLQWAAVAFLSTALVASFDEWHQSFLPSRTGTFRDVVLDSSAAVVAQMVLFITLKARSRTTAH